MKRRNNIKQSKTSARSEIVEATVIKGVGIITFDNGDTYEGEFQFQPDQGSLVKQGKGVYITNDFNIYQGEWKDNKVADSEIHIRYNNDAEYIGKIDPNGGMDGPGIYKFPDGSSIESTWNENQPSEYTVYREPLGFAWIVEDISESTISFSPGNHFWRDMIESTVDENTPEATDSP